MKVAYEVVQDRRMAIARHIGRTRYVSIEEICRKFKVSEPTARRDLTFLEKENLLRRTNGGALAEFNLSFESYNDRLSRHREAKGRMARAALSFFKPHQVCFLDVGSTIRVLSDSLLQSMKACPLTLVTNHIAIGDQLSSQRHFKVHLLGGEFFKRQAMLLGKNALKALDAWQFDVAFLGAEGMNAEGVWNSQEDVVCFQRAVMARCEHAIFCLDSSKLKKSAPQFLCPWEEVGYLITNASLKQKNEAGIPLPDSQWISS